MQIQVNIEDFDSVCQKMLNFEKKSQNSNTQHPNLPILLFPKPTTFNSHFCNFLPNPTSQTTKKQQNQGPEIYNRHKRKKKRIEIHY
jgi:hypothetical protein